jgi:carbon monoxide dehydrogenase subunit G
MKFDNSFELPLPVDQTWALLLDVPRIAPCMPGAELVEIENDRSFSGEVSARLGPVALTFKGRALIEPIDNDNHKARIKAQGLDAKGRGGASAVVDFEVRPIPACSKVVIGTDLTLSGSVAQYGRGAGVIREVEAQLTREFAEALQRQLSAERVPAGEAAAAPSPSAVHEARAISGLSLVFRALAAALRNTLGVGKRN